jgi:hypothetical protein
MPVLAWTGPEGSRISKRPEFLNSRHMKVVRLSALGTGRLHPQEIFMLEAEWTPGPQCSRKDYVNEEFQWHQRPSQLRHWVYSVRWEALRIRESW